MATPSSATYPLTSLLLTGSQNQGNPSQIAGVSFSSGFPSALGLPPATSPVSSTAAGAFSSLATTYASSSSFSSATDLPLLSSAFPDHPDYTFRPLMTAPGSLFSVRSTRTPLAPILEHPTSSSSSGHRARIKTRTAQPPPPEPTLYTISVPINSNGPRVISAIDPEINRIAGTRESDRTGVEKGIYNQFLGKLPLEVMIDIVAGKTSFLSVADVNAAITDIADGVSSLSYTPVPSEAESQSQH